MLKIIDELLNKITMYRLTLYYLIAIVFFAVCISFFDFLPYNALDIIISSVILITFSYLSNLIFAKLFKAVTNIESVFITALILVLIMPIKFPSDSFIIVVTGILAMASKYLLTVNKSHIFNPSAVAVVAISLLSSTSASWWVGTPVMLPIIVVGGILVMRKTQREDLILSFTFGLLIFLGIATFIRTNSIDSIISVWDISLFHSALLFFTFVMLVEPLTSPSTRKLRGFFGYFVAVLYAFPQFRFINFIITPEIALIMGNIFSHLVSPNYRFNLYLKNKKKLTNDTFEFEFDKQNDLNFIPGQYMEWTLPHKNADSRGNRRYFSISSSPTEKDLTIGVKFYNPSSTYKKELLGLQVNGRIIASQVAGSFTMPKKSKAPLVFIAGGVGITPFRSIIQYILDKNLFVNIVLLYTNKTKEDIIYKDVFDKAQENGVKTIYNLTDLEKIPNDWNGTKGHITTELIQKEIPDYLERIFYISGPQLMVQNFKEVLISSGVKRNKIVTDFFPGYEEKN
ncbi:MAG TPA: hypothetical protein VES68_00265 [Candidatus Sulfotelmatobacter sp.]|nr:hypothetical protein [Candidatus Sulfotelmatobacter sp.]